MVKINLDDYDAVIFDMDGTLVDSMWIWTQIDIEYFGMHGMGLPSDFQASIEGKSFVQTADYVKETYNFEESTEVMMDRWNEMAREKYSNDVCYKEGVVDFLKECKIRNIKLGIATSNSKELYNAAAKHLSFGDYFDYALTGTEITNGKPAPDVYLLVADKLGVSPNRCLVFEDVIPGIQAGHNAGMQVIGVDDEHNKALREGKIKEADYYIYNFNELEYRG